MSEQDKPRVITTIADGVAEVRLNRAEKRNAFDTAMCNAIVEAGAALTSDSSVRAVVLSGDGASFCAGIDLGMLGGLSGSSRPDGEGRPRQPTELSDSAITHMAQQAAWVWQEVPVPVIAAIHGHAYGAGIQIALGADIRIAHPDTALSVREVHWGLVPDMTGTLTLLSLAPLDVVKELVFTARVFDAREALQMGLVTRLAEDPREAALGLAREIAGRSPDAVRASKRVLNRAMVERAAGQFAAERDEIGRLLGSPNQAETMLAHMEQREPRFSDPT